MRYQVVTYSRKFGIDEKLDFDRKKDAITHARHYGRREKYDYAAVLDRKTLTAIVIFGDIDAPVFSDSVEVVAL
jgi:hypothetical protein